MRLRTLIIGLLLWATPVLAAPPDALPDGGSGVVAAVIDGDTVRLQNGKSDIRLVGIQAPKLPLGRKGFAKWPRADEAKAALEDLVKGQRVTLRLGANPQDRNGRTLAHLVRADGLWIQEEMLRRGMARVYTFPDNRQLAPELFAAEATARAAQRGIWSDAYYAVRSADPEKLAADKGTFQVIEGRIVDAANVRGRVFFNFGADFRTDFTAVIAPDVMALFKASGLAPVALKGKAVRVRGYLRNYNGPTTDITHPEQIEVLERVQKKWEPVFRPDTRQNKKGSTP